MSRFRGIFSPDYRKAQEAEAAGALEEAARGYALCGDREKVAEMHRLRAERADGPDPRIDALRAALRFTDAGTTMHRSSSLELARALFERGRNAGGTGDKDRADLREAARRFAEVGEAELEGDCLLLLGEPSAAAHAFERGGHVERLEVLLDAEATRARRERDERDAFAEYQLHLETGERTAALRDIRRCAHVSQSKAEYRRLGEALEARRLTQGLVDLRADGQWLRLCGTGTARVGRDPACELPLRDPSVSRTHCVLTVDGQGARLRDAGSRSGTRLRDLLVDRSADLRVGEGDALTLGAGSSLRVRSAHPGVVVLDCEHGLDRGRTLVCFSGTLPLDGLLPGAASGSTLGTVDGVPVLTPAPGAVVRLGDRALTLPVELIRGDRLTWGKLVVEVL
jgi:hypothetical protein